MTQMSARATVLLGGDCGPTHGPADGFPMAGYTELLQPVLRQADVRCVNCMRTYSTRNVRMAHAPQVGQPVEMADIYTHGMIDAVTMANNHSYDSGPEAMLDTRALLNSRGIQVTGAGRNLAEARQAARFEKNGVKIAYLGWTAVAPAGAEAGPDKPGVAALHVQATYETRGAHEPVRVRTTPDPEDLAALVDTIAALRREVDVVILAFHAGVLRLPRVISDYQVTVAHAAIDAGADLVVGHAPHLPKAIESYRGKAIFYSVGVFAMTKPFPAPPWQEPAWMHGAVRNHVDLDPAFPLMPYGTPSTTSLLARAEVSKAGVARVSFVPMAMDARYRPEPLRRGDPRFAKLVDYMAWTSVDMPYRYRVEGDEVVVLTD